MTCFNHLHKNFVYPATFIHKPLNFCKVSTLENVSLSCFFTLYHIIFRGYPMTTPTNPHPKIWGSGHPQTPRIDAYDNRNQAFMTYHLYSATLFRDAPDQGGLQVFAELMKP